MLKEDLEKIEKYKSERDSITARLIDNLETRICLLERHVLYLLKEHALNLKKKVENK